MTGCAVYPSPYTYSAYPVYVQPPSVYQDPWPVRVPVLTPVPQAVAELQQAATIYEDNRQYHYYPAPQKKKP
jgi:hypothetical protein